MSATLIGPISKALSIDDAGNRTHTVVYAVYTSATTEGPISAYTCGGLPQIGEMYNVNGEVDLEAFCCGPTGEITLAESDVSHRKWHVPVVWKTGGSPTDRSSAAPDQHLQVDANNWVISGDTAFLQWAMEVDAYDTPIRNSAGCRFNPAPETEIASPVITLQRRTSYLPLITWANVVNSINSASYLGLDAYWWKCTRWRWNVEYRGNGSACIMNTVELSVKTDTWLLKPLDQGFYYIDPARPVKDDGTTNLLPILVRGELTSEPQLLDGNGGVLSDGATPVILDGTHGGRDNGPFYKQKYVDFNTYFPAYLPGPFVSA